MNIVYKGKKMKLPDFLIVGAAKSGTTSLYFYLKEHPQIFMPANKEPWFFSFMGNPPDFRSPDPLNGVISDFDDYSNLFKEANKGQIVGEASPSYLYTYKTTIDNIKEVYGKRFAELKIVIVLRNPADRAFSQYRHFKKNFQEPLSFREATRPKVIAERMKSNWNIFYDYIGFGMYYKQVKAYLDAFSNVKIILFEDLKSSTDQTVKDLLGFLKADENILPRNIKKQYNISKIPRKNFFAPLYKFFLFSNNNLKKKLASYLPESLRQNAVKLIKKILLKRKTLSKVEKEELMKLFEDDYKKVKELIDSSSYKKSNSPDDGNRV